MLAEDVAPSRLEKSKQIVSQIINQLGSDRIGIVAYAAAPVLPITTDYSVAKMFCKA
jgi:Ca-activated chloride channel family protein